MSWPFAAQSRASHPAGQHAGETSDQDGQSGGYLTDGVELYRSLGDEVDLEGYTFEFQ